MEQVVIGVLDCGRPQLDGGGLAQPFGLAATGKSTVIHELARLGYKAVDTDCNEAWEEEVNPGTSEQVRMSREDRIQALLSIEDADVLVVSSTVPNRGKFYSQFDHIVLLSAPVPVTLSRPSCTSSSSS